MKTFTLALFFFVFGSVGLFAQETSRVTVQDNQDMQGALKGFAYRYPTFRTGKVFLPNGKYNTAKLNLNLLTDQLQFIDYKKDTLTILSPDLLQYVEIDTSTFIYSNGFLEIIGEYSPVTLAVSRKLEVADRQRTGAYGTKTSAASIATISTGYTDNIRYSPTVYEDLLMKKEANFYMVDENKKAILVNKRNVLNLFSSRKAQLSQYIKQNKPNYKKEKDVKALLLFAIAD